MTVRCTARAATCWLRRACPSSRAWSCPPARQCQMLTWCAGVAVGAEWKATAKAGLALIHQLQHAHASWLPPCLPLSAQAYNINIRRTFQLPASEPLGDDWGQGELHALVGAPQRCAAAIQQATGNADPEIAAARRAAAYAVGVADSLPEGEQRQAVLAALAQAQRLAEEAATTAKLPTTTVRAGKIQRRTNSRGNELRADGQRVTRPLLNRAGSKRQPLVDDVICGDEFKKRPRKGKATDKVGGAMRVGRAYAAAATGFALP